MKIFRLLVAFTLICFTVSPTAEALLPPPPPDGGYPNGNTAEGTKALFSITTGGYNTGNGWNSLRTVTTGSFNTGVGAGTLVLNTGNSNTASGTAALLLNTAGANNTANGAVALLHNTTGDANTAIGQAAMEANTDGCGHVAVGLNALVAATAGCTIFAANTAVGTDALASNTTGNGNTAIGYAALLGNTTGAFNTAIGNSAGSALTTGDNNIDIGNAGAAGESNTIRIGVQGTQTFAIIAGISNDIQAFGTPVIVTTDGYLGVATSSARFKDEIRQMDNASEALFALNPVTFRYKKEIDPAGILQFGLVAEDVEKVNAALVVRDKKGKPYSVRYDQVNAMLLNEFLKAHRKIQELEGNAERQQKQIETLAAGLKKVSAQLATANGAAGMRSDIDGPSREADVSGSEQVSPSRGGLQLSKAAPQTASLPAVAPREGGNNQ